MLFLDYTVREVIEYVRENDVKFIGLVFCDLFGTQKSVSIMAEELPRAFSEGVSFDASAVTGFLSVDRSDLFLHPDPGTLAVLPWRPGRGRAAWLFCDIRYPDGSPFEGDGRTLLKNACRRAGEMGFGCRVGAECEFYLFALDDRTNPTRLPIDRGGYLDVAPADRGETIRRDICLVLEEMQIMPECSHHEQGPGQNEIVFRHADALLAADQFVTFRSIVRSVAAQNGMFASFLPKPLENVAGSGLHINLSLTQNERNIFVGDPKRHCPEAESFIAGILCRICEITAFLNPLTNSYRRLGSFEAPRFVTWAHANRSQLIRIPASTGGYTRMELRSPDPACNPYLTLALLLHAGLDGIKERLPLAEACEHDLYAAPPQVLAQYERLPESLGEALSRMERSDFVRRVLPEICIQKFLAAKRSEQALYDAAEDKSGFEYAAYFERY